MCIPEHASVFFCILSLADNWCTSTETILSPSPSECSFQMISKKMMTMLFRGPHIGIGYLKHLIYHSSGRLLYPFWLRKVWISHLCTTTPEISQNLSVKSQAISSECDAPGSREKLWEDPLLVILGTSISFKILTIVMWDINRMRKTRYCFPLNKSIQLSGKQHLRVDESPAEVWDNNWRSRLERRVPNHFVLDGFAVRTQRAVWDGTQHGSIDFQVLIQSVDLDPIHLLTHLSCIQLYGQRDVTEDVLRPERNVLPTDSEQLDVVHRSTGVPVWGNKCHPDSEGLWSQRVTKLQLQVAALGLGTGWRHRVLVDCRVGTPRSDAGFTRLLNVRVPWKKEGSKDRAQNKLESMGNHLHQCWKKN